MTLGISIPSPPTRGSPSSDDSSQVHTPMSPTFAEPSQRPSNVVESSSSRVVNINGNKRKATRRTNTAERRATHNAVERARRETLNGRFLDLAALLPNLSQIRRPSKSAIVNSSIAHIHASRRHRLLASRELRLLKHEADSLRQELNEWRDRARIPRVQEPQRGDAFSMILSGEIEILPIPNADEEEGEYVYGDEEGAGTVYASESLDGFSPMNAPPMSSNIRLDISRGSPSSGYDVSMEHQMMRRAGGPMVASPGEMVVENPAMGIVYNSNMGGSPYSVPFAADIEQQKWGPGTKTHEQGIMPSVSRRSSLATSDVRRNRDRAMSTSTTSSNGNGSPVHMTYYDPGWNATMGGMAPNMGANMGLMGGSPNGTLANGGAAFSAVI